MGKKSEKKVKSERVNALRKQYDAFLEEDKKRKERNEYILGRLDNMRYSSNAVQVRHKPIVYGDVMPIFNRGAYRPEQFEPRGFQSADTDFQINRTSQQNVQLDVSRNYLDNTALLKEISKKYILIPKLRSSIVNDYVATIPPQSLPTIAVSSPLSNTTSKEDWKSKYDILEQLKKKEKEELTGKYVDDELYPVKEKQSPCKDDTKIIDDFSPKQDIDGSKPPETGDGYALQSYGTKELTTKYEHDVAEKDSTSDKARVENETHNIERLKISDTKDQDPTSDQAPGNSASDYTNPNTNIDYDDYKLHDQSVENNAPLDVNLITSENTNEEISERRINGVLQQEYPVQYEQPIEVEGKYPDPNTVYLDTDDYSPIQVANPSALVGPIHNEPTVDNTADIKEDEAVEYPVEMLNVQEFTPKDDVKLIDGENVNPKYFASEDGTDAVHQNDPGVYENNPQTEIIDEHAVDPQDSSGIEAFDAEQREMFYSEDTSEHASNQQQGTVQNQEYPDAPAQEYAYYESPATALQEQEYPAEINEHEESTTPYDQNYEQQYGTEYEQQEYQGQEQQQYVQPEGYDQTEQQYVQQEGYDQTEQQYVQQEGYDQSEQQYVQQEGYDQTEQQQYAGYDQTGQQYQDYEYQQPDHDTVQSVQQALDNEAGYVDELNSEATKVETQEEPVVQTA